MKLDSIYQAVQQELPKSRWEHSLRVVDTAVKLAEIQGMSIHRVKVAAILHDYCKYWPESELLHWMKQGKYPDDYLRYNKVWHAFVGAEVARAKFSIEDEEVLDAIRFHTSGRPGMTLIEKIIYLADYIEPGRSFVGLDEVRDLAQVNIDEALLKAIENTIITLIKRKQRVFPLTLHARNDLVDQIAREHLKGEFS